MGGISSWLAAKLAFFPPNPPSYTLVRDTVTKELRMSGVQNFQNVDIFRLPTRRGQEIVAIYVKKRAAKLTLLYSHGNAVDLGSVFSFLFKLSNSLRVNLMAYDYSGYGKSTGKPSEKNSYADIEAACRCLEEKYAVKEEQIILYGQSIGSGPTVDLAARLNNLGGVVLQGAILSGLRVICPVKKSYCFDIFNNVDKIGRVNCPVLVMHGALDDVVDFSHGEQLWQLCKDKFQPLWLDYAGHNDLESYTVFYTHLKKFLSSVERRLLPGVDICSSMPKPTVGRAKPSTGRRRNSIGRLEFPLTESGGQLFKNPSGGRHKRLKIDEDPHSNPHFPCFASQPPLPIDVGAKRATGTCPVENTTHTLSLNPQPPFSKSPDFNYQSRPSIYQDPPSINKVTHQSALSAGEGDKSAESADDILDPQSSDNAICYPYLDLQPPSTLQSCFYIDVNNETPVTDPSPLATVQAAYLPSLDPQPPLPLCIESNPDEVNRGSLLDSPATHYKSSFFKSWTSGIFNWKIGKILPKT